MARITVPGFIGGSNRLRATNQDIEDTINFYVEPTAPGQSKVPGALLPTPGLRFKAQLANGTGGQASFYQDGRAFCVINRASDAAFIEYDSNFVITYWGAVSKANPQLPASIVSNGTAGHQLLIVSGGNGYVFDLTANTLTLIDTSNYPGTGFPVGLAKQCEFLDGYGIVLVSDSRQFQISALEDFTSWDPLDVAQRSEGSDNLIGVIRNHRELWFPGTKTSEVWYDSGDALFPFAPVPGVFIDSGAVSPSMCRIAQTVAWLSIDERGQGIVYLADGYTPQRVSTLAVEEDLQSSQNLLTTTLFSMQQDGHLLLWIRQPDLQWSWVYDVTTQVWCKRAIWNTTTCVFQVHPANTHAFAFNADHVVTSALDGSLYTLDPTAYTDEIAA